MGLIEDNNGNPLTPDEPEESKANGKSREPLEGEEEATQDVRLIATGLLIYNLVLTTQKLMMNNITLEQMEIMMQQQKMVTEPPPVTQMRAAIEQQVCARDIIVTHLNTRFSHADEAFWARIGVDPTDRVPTEDGNGPG